MLFYTVLCYTTYSAILYYAMLYYTQVGPSDRPAPPSGRPAPRCKGVCGAATPTSGGSEGQSAPGSLKYPANRSINQVNDMQLSICVADWFPKPFKYVYICIGARLASGFLHR